MLSDRVKRNPSVVKALAGAEVASKRLREAREDYEHASNGYAAGATTMHVGVYLANEALSTAQTDYLAAQQFLTQAIIDAECEPETDADTGWNLADADLMQVRDDD